MMILFVALVNCRGYQSHSRHFCGHQLCSCSRQLIPLLVNNRLHTGASQRKETTRFFNFTFRHIDDVILLNNSKFDEIKDSRDTARSPSYLDLNLEIDNECRLRTELYDKRYDFNFLILNFPFICSNIPAAPVYGVYIFQFIRYSRTCGSYHDYLNRGLLLTRKLLNQGFLVVKLSSFPVADPEGGGGDVHPP